MTMDNGMDAQLPISREGLLAALATERTILITVNALLKAGRLEDAINELSFAIEGIRLLQKNIINDACNNYPPVIRPKV